jgi:hypothetical protein
VSVLRKAGSKRRRQLKTELTARAVVVPTWHKATLLVWVNGAIYDARDFAGLTDAVAEADNLRSLVAADGWTETP